MRSTAISPDAVARISGYGLGFQDNRTEAGVLPQQVLVLSPVSSASESGYDKFNTIKRKVTLADIQKDMGICPAYQVLSILKGPGGAFSPKVDVIPVPVAGGSAATCTITVAGTVTEDATHTILFNGRSTIGGKRAQFDVRKGETAAQVAVKANTAIGGVICAPVTASVATSVVTATTTWKDKTANEVSLTVDNGGKAAGVTYTITAMSGGAGTVDIATALAQFGETWYTVVLNPWGADQFDALSAFNGIPDPDMGGTGRWGAKVVRPFIAVFGSTLSSATALKALSAGREQDLTNALAPAPNSPGFSWEAAANMIYRFAGISNQKPHRDVADEYYPDMPAPVSGLGEMADWDVRQDLVENRVSTVTYSDSMGYRIEDFVTFRGIDGQTPQARDFRYCRDIVLDMNVAFRYKALVEGDIYGKVILDDEDVIDGAASEDAIKPKQAKGLLFDFFDDCQKALLITKPGFSKENLTVELSATNASRLDIRFPYMRTQTNRIVSTTAMAGFSYGGN